MRNINFDMMIAALVMLILNCRGYYKYVMGKQLSEREADRRECMLFPNLYKWVCICSSLLIAVVLFVNDTLRMYKNDDIRMYNFDCITDTIVEVITTCNTYTLLTVHLL